MRIMAFVTQKGGSGKTTLCVNLAVVASQNNLKVLILDMDQQGTAEAWYQDREAAMPKLVRVNGTELSQALELAKVRGYDLVLIDTPGRDEPSVAAAVRAADFCIIPCRPTSADMKAQPSTVAMISRLSKPMAFVVMQTPPRGFRITEARNGLSVLGTVAPVSIVARASFQDAQSAGMAVTEYEPEGKGADEVQQLWQWIKRKVEKLVDEPTKQENIA